MLCILDQLFPAALAVRTESHIRSALCCALLNGDPQNLVGCCIQQTTAFILKAENKHTVLHTLP